MKLGQLSEKYESNGDPGAYSNAAGDKGGKSYGLYQLSLDSGALEGYMAHSKYSQEFKWLPLGSDEFTAKWKAIAKRDRDGFAKDQHNYHMNVYYTPVRKYLDTQGVPNNNAVNQVLWSTSTQQGPKWAKDKFKALAHLASYDLIKAIYELRAHQFMTSKYYNGGIAARMIRDSVLKRYEKEMKEALELV